MPPREKRTSAIVSWYGNDSQKNTARNSPVSTNRETVNLFGRFIRLNYRASLWLVLRASIANSVNSGPRVKVLRRLANQVVIRMAHDSHTGKFTKRQPSANINAPINVRRISFAAANQILPPELRHGGIGFANEPVFPRADARFLQLAPRRSTFHQHVDLPAHRRLGRPAGDLVLLGHRALAALL